MTEKEIMDYVLLTPENTNPAILRGMLEQLKEEGKEEGKEESDFTVVKVTITNEATESFDFHCMSLNNDAVNFYIPSSSITGADHDIVLYKGSANGVVVMSGDVQVPVTAEVTGDITYSSSNFVITGPGTITFKDENASSEQA